MTGTDLGIAIVGLGMGANRARQVAETDGARLVAVADIDVERAQQVAGEHGVEWTADYHELLSRDDIDVIYAMTPSGLHAQIAIDAAQAGKHVITTKPIEVSLERADAMIAACQAAGVKLVVDFGQRYNPNANKIKAALEQGLFGRLILSEARLKWFRSDDYYEGWHGTWALDGGGSLINQTVHFVDLLCWFVGPPRMVRGRIGIYNHQIETEDLSLVMMQYPDDSQGVIVCTTTFPESQPAGVEIHGTAGGAILSGGQLTFWKTAGAAEVEAPDHPLNATDDMIRAVRSGGAPWCDGHEGRKSLALIRAIYESAQSDETLVEFKGW